MYEIFKSHMIQHGLNGFNWWKRIFWDASGTYKFFTSCKIRL